MTSKICAICDGLHSLHEFSVDKSKKDGRSIYCRGCLRKKQRVHRATEKSKTTRRLARGRYKEYNKNYNLIARYGITLKDFVELLASQGNKCKICETEKPDLVGFVVDHSHKTGKIRGILCNLCNVALGSMKDSPELAKKMAIYLENGANNV